LNQFPSNFVHIVGKHIIYILATKSPPSLEGPEWENIFADAINGQWKPSPVGLDDIVKGNCAWSAKSVKNNKPFSVGTVRLISGRNNPEYSFHNIEDTDNGIGKQVLNIWNARVDEIRNRYAHARTVILIKGNEFNQYSVFEIETLRYQPELFVWRRNVHNNLEGFELETGKHRFTWQRHGSQFTIVEDVPEQRLKFIVRIPPALSIDQILSSIDYDPSWIQIVE
jgi:hypothetical protein